MWFDIGNGHTRTEGFSISLIIYIEFLTDFRVNLFQQFFETIGNRLIVGCDYNSKHQHKQESRNIIIF